MRYAKWVISLVVAVALVAVGGVRTTTASTSVTHNFVIAPHVTSRPTDSQINAFIHTHFTAGHRIYGLTVQHVFMVMAPIHPLEMRHFNGMLELRHTDNQIRSIPTLNASGQSMHPIGTWTQYGVEQPGNRLDLAIISLGTFTNPLEGHIFPYPTWGTSVHFTGTISGQLPSLRIRIHDLHAGITPIFDVTNVQGAMWERTINILGVGPFRADLLTPAGAVLDSRNFSISAVPPPPPPTQPVPPPPPVDPVAPPTLGVDPTIWDRIFWAVDYVIWLIGRPFRLLAELLAVVVDNVQALVGEQFGVLGAVMGAFYSALPPEASVLLSTLLMVFTVVTIYRLVRP